MPLRLIAPATTYPVTLAEAKLHCRVDQTEEDSLISSMIAAASAMAEQATGRAMLTQTWELSMAAFPQAFSLSRVPVQSIGSIKYLDTAGVLQTLASNLYVLDDGDDFGPMFVLPAFDTEWPPTRQDSNAVRLRYVAGYANPAAVPEAIKAWIKVQIGAMYDNREAFVTQGQIVQLGFVDGLLDPYRVWQ